jgi:hypothetical protein
MSDYETRKFPPCRTRCFGLFNIIVLGALFAWRPSLELLLIARKWIRVNNRQVFRRRHGDAS